MANNLRSNIVIKGNDKVSDMMKTRIDRCENLTKEKNEIFGFASAFYNNVETSDDGVSVMNSWSNDNLGSKWTYLSDVMDDLEFTIESAWYPPKEFFTHLYKLCYELDNDCEIEVTYEDESYNPIGAFVFKKDLDGTPCVWQEEDNDIEDPTVDMDFDDEDYEQTQMEFMESLYARSQELLRECHELIHTDGEPVFE